MNAFVVFGCIVLCAIVILVSIIVCGCLMISSREYQKVLKEIRRKYGAL